MLVSNPVRGTIKPDAKHYPDHESAVFRPPGSRISLVTQDFGPSTVTEEPTVDWPGGESDIFGKRIRADEYENFHAAIDISKGPCNRDVLAAAPGKVKVSKVIGGAGTIEIAHGLDNGHRYRTGYVHLSERFVVVDDEVETGAVIGKIGTGGISTGCHLHFFIEKDGMRVDPWRRLKQNTSIDPDAPIAIVSTEVPDVPIPASNEEYVAGNVAVIGNTAVGAIVRTGSNTGASPVRTVAAGQQETWKPTCWVKGQKVGVSDRADRWLTRWNKGKWEFTHFDNVRSVTPL